MIVGCDRNELLGLLLTNDISVQLLFDLVGSRNIIDGKDRLFAALFFLFYLGAGLAKASSGAKNIPQIESSSRSGRSPGRSSGRPSTNSGQMQTSKPASSNIAFARRLVCGPGGSRISGLVVISGHHAKWESSTEQVEKISRRR